MADLRLDHEDPSLIAGALADAATAARGFDVDRFKDILRDAMGEQRAADAFFWLMADAGLDWKW